MNITFMIGNGFDIGCDMKTKYVEAYREYVSIRKKEDSQTIIEFKSILDGNDITWGDFEMGMAKYYKQLGSTEAFIECVQDFTSFLTGYLRKQEDVFWRSHYSNSPEMLERRFNHLTDSLCRFYDGCSNNTANEIHEEMRKAASIRVDFISFNYTTVFEDIMRKAIKYNKIEEKGLFGPRDWTGKVNINLDSTNHIHGKLEEDMVMGVDSIKQIEGVHHNIEAIQRCFVKPYFNRAYDKRRMDRAVGTIMSSDIICVMGFAFGQSDLTWIDNIKRWLLYSPNHQLFYYDLELMKAKHPTSFEILDKPMKAKQSLMKKLGLSEQESIKQIHIPIGRWFFNISKV